MSKEAYYFSHDANARQDPKILEMLSVYGAEGYGWYWILVEMLREQSDHKLKLTGKYTFNALAMQMHCNPNTSEQFVNDCIKEFALFDSDGEYFWSNSLLRRMAMKEEISEKRRKAAEKRWSKNADKSTKHNDGNTDDMQMHSKKDANAMQGKERKGNKSKVNKKKYLDYVYLSTDEYDRLVNEFGQALIDSKIEDLDNYLGSRGNFNKYKDHNRTIRSWIKKDNQNQVKKKVDWEGL